MKKTRALIAAILYYCFFNMSPFFYEKKPSYTITCN